MINKGIDFGDIHVPRLEGNSMDEEEYIEDEELEKGSDLDRVRAILAGEGEGIDEIDQLIEMATDPQLKEMAKAIKQDESKHKAALEQWLEMQDEGGSDEPEPEDTPDPDEGEEEQIEADADPDDGISEEDLFGDETEPEEEATSDLIDDIREVLAEHEAEKAEDEEPEEDEDEEDEDLPEFLKEDDDEEEDEDEVSKVMKSYRVPIIVAKGSDQQIVYGVVSEPNVIDLQGDRLSKSEIRAACHKFMQTGQRIGKEHSGVAKASIIESYIAPTDFKCNGQVVKSGSWVMAVKIHDNDLWQAVKKGDITGFSIAGTGTRTPF
jgi:hypothetical protein